MLSLWTGSVKRLGYQLIAFMLLVFRDWNEEEVNKYASSKARSRKVIHLFCCSFCVSKPFGGPTQVILQR